MTQSQAPQLKTRIIRVDPTKLSLLEKNGDRRNARYMTGEQTRRLTENVQQDGVLTSVPLVYTPRQDFNPDYYRGKDELLVISGNHRVKAAIRAKIAEIDVMEIVSPVSDEKIVALQLSHNAIAGQDDASILAELYESLSLEAKLYSGLTDDDFEGLEELNFQGLSFGNPEYVSTELMFFPAEQETFEQLIRTLKLADQIKKRFWLAHLQDFERVFDAVVATKESKNILNTSVAFRAMADLALERLEQLASEAAEEAADTQSKPGVESEPDGQAEDTNN